MHEMTDVAPTLDLADMARRMIDASAAGTTGLLRLRSPAETYGLLGERDPQVTSHFRRELARQLGAALLWMDPRVNAVYERRDHYEGTWTFPLQLIIEVDFQTAPLKSLIAALSDALSRECAARALSPPGDLFDALIVDARGAQLLFGESRGLESRLELLTSRDRMFAGEAAG